MENIIILRKSERYLVQTWYQTKSSGVKLLDVYGVSKSLDPNIKLEKQNNKPLKGNRNLNKKKPCIDQGRASMRRRSLLPIIQTITQTLELSKKIPEVSKIESRITNQMHSTAPMQSDNQF